MTITDQDSLEIRCAAVGMFLRGVNITEIAKALEVSRPTVYRYLQECNIDYKYRSQNISEEDIAAIQQQITQVLESKDTLANEIKKAYGDSKVELAREKKISQANAFSIKMSRLIKRLDDIEKVVTKVTKKMDLLENTISQLVGLIDLMMTEEKRE